MNYKFICIAVSFGLLGDSLLRGSPWWVVLVAFIAGVAIGGWFPNTEVKRQMAIDIRTAIAEEKHFSEETNGKGIEGS